MFFLRGKHKVRTNRKGVRWAAAAIERGAVNRTARWSFSAADGNRLLGDPPDWERYGRHFLAVNDEFDADTKQHYMFPVAKFDGDTVKVFRSGLIAARVRAAQNGYDDVFAAAGRLLNRLDAKDEKAHEDFERRNAAHAGVELRQDDGKPLPTLVGYAAVFDTDSELLGFFRERIAPGAFRRAIEEKQDVRALVDHTGGLMTIGRSTRGTLRLQEDDKGLRVEIDPPQTQAGRDVVELVRRGDLSQMSFGFRAVKDEWLMPGENGHEGLPLRVLRDVDLFDVSVVSFPAYPDTSVAVRALRRLCAEAVCGDVDLECEQRFVPPDEWRARRAALEAHALWLKQKEING